MLRYDYILIKTKREREGLTQHQAADLAGMNLRTWQKYENNESEPLISQYLKMVRALGCNPADLLRDE